MAIPFSRLKEFLTPSSTCSLGDSLAALLAGSCEVNSLLDCLCSTSEPAIYHSDHRQSPLRHNDLRSFITNFSLPCSRGEGLGPNDRVMLAFPTGPENAVALLALASYHTCVPVNASCTASELRDDARRLNVKAVLTTKDAEHHLELRRLYTEQGCDIIYIEPRTSGPPGLFDFSLFDNLPAIPRSLPSQLHGLADQSLILHTSGTSGSKKAVPYRLISLMVGAFAIIQSWDLQPTDVNLNMMPLFHVGGIIRNLLAPMLSGGSVVMCAGFDPIAFWSLAAQLKATWYYAAPTIHHAIIASWPESTISLKEIHIRMICNGAGELVPSLASRIKEIFTGAVILPSYGMTECMPITTPPINYQLDRPRSSGVVCGPHLSIRDPADIDRPLPSEKTGAICVRGIPTFEGYEVSPDIAVPLDRSGFSREGWFNTGDVGHMDADGYLYITGRSKEIINKGGEVISPSEVEDAIMSTAGDLVKNTLAFTIEHDVLQECIGVVITPMPAKPRIGLSQLQDRLSGHLHPSKWPFAIVYMDDLPKNSTGKLLRINLASRLSIGCLSDIVPARFRHFEATTPSVLASLKDPIPCSKVSIDLHDIECILARTPSVKDVALRFSHQESLEGFLSVDPGCGLGSEDVKTSVSSVLHGYSIPDVLHILEGVPLVRNGELVDFGALEHQVTDKHSSSMTKLELLVCDIFATLLPIDPMWCNRDSDFFLLGGNSLLLGQLSYHIRKQAGVNVAVTTLFNSSTVEEIALLIEEEQIMSYPTSATSFGKASFDTFTGYDQFDQGIEGASRDQTHPFNLIVQAVPLAFAPLQAALFWSSFLIMLSFISGSVHKTIWHQLGALLATLVIAKLCVAIFCPLAAIAFKWIVIGKYKKGTYRMWSVYYLRWWIVDQALRCADKGIFAVDPFLEILYYRMLGAKIGSHVAIDPHATLREFDLLNLQDGCRIDVSQVRGFCVERNGFFSLDYINIGRNAVINTYTVISPGADIPEGTVYGPHASSHNEPSPPSYAAYNRTSISEPNWMFRFFVAYPIMMVVLVISYLPWFAVLVLMMSQPPVHMPGVQKLGSIILYFASPHRIGLHMFSVAVRAILTPSLQLFLGILVNRLLRLGAAHGPADSQRRLLRRFINSHLLSQKALSCVFKILGAHYEDVSMIYRLMGAKIGKRIYWPGTPVYCNEPELLTIGDDVIFGASPELLTVDQIGSGEITIGDGAMIADRVVLLPGTTVGRHTVMGTGALGKRDTTYADGSVWIGSVNGEAVCLSKGYRTAEDAKEPTITPFGRAFYEKGANFFVTPYIGVLMTNVTVVTLSALYWTVGPVITIQILKLLLIHHPGRLDLSGLHWYSFAILYAIIAICFMVIMNVLAFNAMLSSILTKWMLIGRRSVGQYDWDKSSYNQRWQVHRTLDILLFAGYGVGGAVAPLSGSVYIVWYLRAFGAKIGKNCFIYAGHKAGCINEPDLIEFGDNVNLDDCAIVSHINSRGNFTLNFLKIGNGCAMRAGSRLLSGASMEDNTMLCEHTLLTSGEVGESNTVYVGWPAAPVKIFGKGPELPHAKLEA